MLEAIDFVGFQNYGQREEVYDYGEKQKTYNIDNYNGIGTFNRGVPRYLSNQERNDI